MAPWLPRMQVFEFHDQTWFSPWLRAKVQAALTETWTTTLRPLGQRNSPAALASAILAGELGPRVGDYVFVDYCAGGGGPTPSIERYINASRKGVENGSGSGSGSGYSTSSSASSKKLTNTTNGSTNGSANGSANNNSNNTTTDLPPVHFILTDLHPHIPNWALAASRSPNLHYSPHSVDASASPPDLLTRASPPLPSSYTSSSSSKHPVKTFRTFYLAFHHFSDDLAASILRDTLATSHGFAIVELQDRHLTSFLALCLLGLGVLFFAPYYAWRWRSPGTIFWSWVIPVLPFVLVWDGWMSSLRTRTLDEVVHLMKNCGISATEVQKWDVTSGRMTHLPPFADINWIIATKKEG